MRARHADAFGRDSGYQRLPATGARRDHAICFSRTRADAQPVTVTIAVRWPILLRSGWHDTAVQLPEGRWRDAFSGDEFDGGEQRLDTLLVELPVALLERT